ncbi:MAG: hypothetical protein QOI19_772 [Thermoleophilaceae bacterium]|jgi:hypothetical protein|nr:hypothetical protein [Thermoleophilaceae bacterium]
MPERDFRRVEIGFVGGGGVSMRITEEDYDQLRKALTDGSGARWHQLDAAETTVTVDLSKVAFVRLDTEPGRVGF